MAIKHIRPANSSKTIPACRPLTTPTAPPYAIFPQVAGGGVTSGSMYRLLRNRAEDATLPQGFLFRFQPQSRSTVFDRGEKIFGMAAVYNVLSEEFDGAKEMFASGCFAASIANPKHNSAILFNHDLAAMLGRKESGTGRFHEIGTGLYYECDTPDTTYCFDLLVSMDRGDIRESGVGFSIEKAHLENRGADRVRVIDQARLYECGPCSFPRFNLTSAQSTAAANNLLAARLEVLRTAPYSYFPKSKDQSA